MQKPIVFLDYDGVVNTIYWRKYDNQFCVKICSMSDGFVNNFQAICWLNELYQQKKYDIVVISSWKIKKDYDECLYRGGLDADIKILGKTKNLDNRELEIITWLKDNKYEGQFAIVDDEDTYDILKNHLVLCNSNYGFGVDSMYKTYDILNM